MTIAPPGTPADGVSLEAAARFYIAAPADEQARLLNSVQMSAVLTHLLRELARERRPIRDRRPGAGPATRSAVPYEGLLPRYQRLGEDVLAEIRSAEDDELSALCEEFVRWRESCDALEDRLTRVEAVVVSLLKEGYPNTLSREQKELAKSCLLNFALRTRGTK